jgi:hypothetical protein
MSACKAFCTELKKKRPGCTFGWPFGHNVHFGFTVSCCLTWLFFFLLCAGAGTDWEDPEDPTVIAENELLGAASSIDAAAKKLANLRPRISSTKVIHYFLLSFDRPNKFYGITGSAFFKKLVGCKICLIFLVVLWSDHNQISDILLQLWASTSTLVEFFSSD